MTYYEYNDPILKPRRKGLRNSATDAEKKLWECLQRSRLKGLKFVRQYSVGPYILDFYCPEVRLAVEMDGSQHGSQDGIAYDDERSAYLEDRDIKILRFWNEEVLKNIESVVGKIVEAISNTPSG